jgi:predicted transcriptional regulator
MKALKIGIMSREQYQQRVLDIARGTHKPSNNEPRVWFESMHSLGQVLSDDNRELLKLMSEHQPESIVELAELSGRAPGNLSRTLKTLEKYGIVKMQPITGSRKRAPVARATHFQIFA